MWNLWTEHHKKLGTTTVTDCIKKDMVLVDCTSQDLWTGLDITEDLGLQDSTSTRVLGLVTEHCTCRLDMLQSNMGCKA